MDASTDPFIALAKLLEPRARELRTKYDNEVLAVERDAYARIAQAVFATQGDSAYPDGTFTLRLSFGQIKGYTENGRTISPFTEIRGLYARYSDSQGNSQVNLQGIVFDTNGGGRLPTERYFAATLAERDALAGGAKSIEAVARERGLSPKYLGALWNLLTAEADQADPTGGAALLLDPLRARWKAAQPEDAVALAADVARWQ